MPVSGLVNYQKLTLLKGFFSHMSNGGWRSWNNEGIQVGRWENQEWGKESDYKLWLF